MWYQQKFKSFFWLFPFVFACLGYVFAHFFMRNNEISTPCVIGKKLEQALKEVSCTGLNMRFLREQEDAELPAGVIVEQVPRPHQKVRFNQHVFVTISKRPPAVVAPHVIGQDHNTLTTGATRQGITIKPCWLTSSYPKDLCFAQSPSLGKELLKQGLVTYLSLGKSQLFIFPQLKKQPLSKVRELLEKEGISIEMFHTVQMPEDHVCDHRCIVVDQKPVAGAIVDMNKKLYVQLEVKAEK